MLVKLTRGGEGAIKERKRASGKSVATLLSQLCKGLIELNVRKELSPFLSQLSFISSYNIAFVIKRISL